MKTIETDVAVMGSGLAGLAAGLALAERGVRVAVFEKRPFQGGAVSNTPMITMATRNERAYQDRAFEVHNQFTNFNCNMALARTWINNSWRIPGFITGLGLDFLDVVETSHEELGNINAYTGGFPKGMNLGDYYFLKPRGQGHGAALICLRAARAIEKLGGQMHYNCALERILTEGGRVAGALVRGKDGGEVSVSCKAVIVATGGFSDNREMIREYTGYNYTDRDCSDGGDVFFNHFYNAGLDGDGHRAVWEAGGAKGGVGAYGQHVPGPGVIGFVPWITTDGNQINAICEQPYLMVNRNGRRFIDESMGQAALNIGTAIKNQPGKYAYLIFDEDTLDHLEREGTEYSYMIFRAEKLKDVREQFRRLIEDHKNKHVFVADSMDELCAMAGIDGTGLQETVERYNGYCDNGYDEEFGKQPQYLRPVRQGKKLYCLRIYNCSYHTVGGIRTNGKCEVVTEDQQPIKGLYSAGDCMAAELYGNPPLAACGLSSISLTLGLVSADNAADYIKVTADSREEPAK